MAILESYRRSDMQYNSRAAALANKPLPGRSCESVMRLTSSHDSCSVLHGGRASGFSLRPNGCTQLREPLVDLHGRKRFPDRPAQITRPPVLRSRQRPSNRSDERVSLLCRRMRAVVAEIKTDKTLSDTTKEEIRDIMAVWRNRSGWTREEADLAVSILRHMALAEEKLELRDYTSCINALAKVPACSLAAENMLNYMEESGRPEIRPDRVTINTVIGAFAKSRDPCCARKAERLLLKLEKDYAGGDETRRPNQKSYGKVIDAYARSNQLEKAVDILRKVEQQFRLGNSDIEPSIHMYTTIIEGFANSGRRDAPEKAETVLNSLLELFDERKIDSLRPDKGLFSTVINAYSKSKHPCWGQKALSILKDMKKYDVEVTVKTYNLVISVLVSNGKVKDIERAEDLLRYLEETPDFVPDKYSYAPILEAYVRKNMPDRAERVLLDWASLYNSGIARHMPSSHNYKEVIRCWGRSDAAGSVEKVDRILKCMSEKTSRPMRAIPAE